MKRDSNYRYGVPFGLRSRAQRKYAYINLKNQIRLVTPALGGKFMTDDLLDGANTIVCAAFLGQKPSDYYRVAMQTTSVPYEDAIDELIRTCRPSSLDQPSEMPHVRYCDDVARIARDLLKDLDLGGPSGIEIDFDDDGSWPAAPEIPDEARARQILADAGIVFVQEEWALRPYYEWGTGLGATLNVPALTVEHINSFIDRFFACGCTNFQSEANISLKFEELSWHFNDGPWMTAKDWVALNNSTRDFVASTDDTRIREQESRSDQVV